MVDYIRDAPPTQQAKPALVGWLDRREDSVQIAFNETTEALEFIGDQMVFAQYAAVDIDVAHVDGDIGLGWQPFDFFDRVTVTPKGIVLALTGDFTFILDGIFR